MATMKMGSTRASRTRGAGALLAVVSLGLIGCDRPTPGRPIFELDSTPGFDPRTTSGIDERVNGTIVARPGTPAISGGTLLALRQSIGLTVVADADRDRLLVVDTEARRVLSTLPLARGSEPGRVAEAENGRVFVALRGAHAVAAFDPSETDVQIIEVCRQPRGLAVEPGTNDVHVLCRDGSHYVIDGTTDTVRSREVLPFDDARDVAFRGGDFVLSTFRDPAAYVLDETGGVRDEIRPPASPRLSNTPPTPRVAYRTTVVGETLAMAHQMASVELVDVSTPSAYGRGGGGGCGGLVASAVTIERRGVSWTTMIPGALPVDIAISPDETMVTVALAGEQRTGSSGVMTFPTDSIEHPRFDCDSSGSLAFDDAVAVAYTATGQLLVQRREPAELWIGSTRVPLGGESVFDTGHAIFHGRTGLGLACASCHPEGGDDGHVWEFSDSGRVRTPSMHGGLMDTAPFHWRGDLTDISDLMNVVFEGRMGGPVMGVTEERALGSWLDSLPGSAGQSRADAEAAARGASLFAGAAQCATCHAGTQFTDNRTVDVGTGGSFQVPSLVGVASRLPLMHSGCADTLEARFLDVACGGGDRHGLTSDLADGQRADLIAYLRTL